MKVFKTIAAVFCIVIAGIILISEHQDYQYRLTPEGLARTAQLQADEVLREHLQTRVNMLAKDGCQTAVSAILRQHAAKTITSKSDLADAQVSDMELCLERGVIGGFARSQLENADVLRYLQ